MKHNKYTAELSLAFTMLPFGITNYMTFPVEQETLFRMSMSIVFILSWFELVKMIRQSPNDPNREPDPKKGVLDNMKGYWFIEYKENSTMACSILEIRDKCGSSTASKIIDYSKSLNKLSVLGIQNLQFNRDAQLTQVYAKGDANCSFIRYEYRHRGSFDIIRIDDNVNENPSKKYGTCCEITPEILQAAEICNDKKIARKMLAQFSLMPASIERLLVYMHEKQQTAFAQEVLTAYSTRKMSTKTIESQNVAEDTLAKSHIIFDNKKEGK